MSYNIDKLSFIYKKKTIKIVKFNNVINILMPIHVLSFENFMKSHLFTGLTGLMQYQFELEIGGKGAPHHLSTCSKYLIDGFLI
jgi:hypothetical protein